MQPHNDTSRHAFVLGTGIAGLSIAEILSRNGWHITLLDSEHEIGGDASRSTQNWLHTGWLYAGLPSASAMQGCSKALRLYQRTYGPVLPPEVVNLEASESGITYFPSTSGWFSPEPMHYAFAVRTYDLSTVHKLTWGTYLENVVLRRLRSLGYPTEEARELAPQFLELMNQWESDKNGRSKYRVIPSTDARIETGRVLSSLLHLIGDRTEVVRDAHCELVPNGDRSSIRIDGELHTPDLVVLAAGKSIPPMLKAIGANAIADDFKSISSPIVVLRRALELPNFIRFTPNLPETINHVKYAVDGEDVSTIGSYDYYPVDQRPDISPFVEKVCRRIGIPTSEVVGSYYGTKTELTGKLARRYNHAVDSVNANTFFAIAGKFSQFPLLVSDFAVRVGLRTDIANVRRGLLDAEVSETAPEKIAHRAGVHRPHPVAA